MLPDTLLLAHLWQPSFPGNLGLRISRGKRGGHIRGGERQVGGRPETAETKLLGGKLLA